jgi:hypothetical protein
VSAREAELEREGWVRRFAAPAERLPEAAALYASLGLEVRLEPLSSAAVQYECAGCAPALATQRVIYTRRLP